VILSLRSGMCANLVMIADDALMITGDQSISRCSEHSPALIVELL
jgi:hypothetical protein